MAFLISPLDFEQLFIVNLAGSTEIFSFIAVLLVAFAMSKFRLTSRLALPLFAVFGVIMATYLEGIYILIILLGGLVTFYALSKLAK